MPNTITMPAEEAEVQLINPRITASAVVRFRKESVEVGIETDEFFAQVRLELRGTKIIALLRSSEFIDHPQVVTLYDFATATAATLVKGEISNERIG